MKMYSTAFKLPGKIVKIKKNSVDLHSSAADGNSLIYLFKLFLFQGDRGEKGDRGEQVSGAMRSLAVCFL